MSVKKILENTLVVKNVIVGVQVVVLIGMMSLTTIAGCSSQKKIRNLKNAVKMCRKNNKEIIQGLRKKSKSCNKKIKSCKKIRNKLLKKVESYEKRLCN